MNINQLSAESIEQEAALLASIALSAKLAALPAEALGKGTSELARWLTVTEYQLVAAFPAAQVTLVAGQQAQKLLEILPEWGPLTTIVISGESVFEFKGDFPCGKVAHGYYNLYNRESQGLHGHLHLAAIQHIALLDKPFRGRESYCLLFFAADGTCTFKVYLGRDAQRRLFPQQIEYFQQLRAQYTKTAA